MDRLTKKDWEIIFHELGVATHTIKKYTGYPSEEYREKRLEELGEVRFKVKQRVKK